ncbi:MAG: hypothetical protein COT71_01120 [Candidatus Andersenbacteria bacterium CG10_big_fil_rev_8_21_14_0_10_54_11]|uniref:DUF3307 domain-containing protein n=1 Tax=Candidatus Andersenbacteria bacterium CG10_big_fil_rev_8_21_14_0_10_54_11 TaxID=1974485 RepID=A0A2M6X039_9BACT|nr:MAG: hypothetical protein COT71_01120 [Candidatus Andersenbacteria bacterium CG10_big_fil_rev_8_21_14_0_10_54_11]
MLSLAHTLISLPLAAYLHHPLMIFFAAIILHFLADTILHWNIFYDEYEHYPYTAISLDVLGGILAAYVIVGHSLPANSAIAAIAGGNAPDVLDGIWSLLKKTPARPLLAWLQPYFSFHDKLQHETYNKRAGLLTQAAAVSFAIILVLAA